MTKITVRIVFFSVMDLWMIFLDHQSRHKDTNPIQICIKHLLAGHFSFKTFHLKKGFFSKGTATLNTLLNCRTYPRSTDFYLNIGRSKLVHYKLDICQQALTFLRILIVAYHNYTPSNQPLKQSILYVYLVASEVYDPDIQTSRHKSSVSSMNDKC